MPTVAANKSTGSTITTAKRVAFAPDDVAPRLRVVDEVEEIVTVAELLRVTVLLTDKTLSIVVVVFKVDNILVTAVGIDLSIVVLVSVVVLTVSEVRVDVVMVMVVDVAVVEVDVIVVVVAVMVVVEMVVDVVAMHAEWSSFAISFLAQSSHTL